MSCTRCGPFLFKSERQDPARAARTLPRHPLEDVRSGLYKQVMYP